MSGSQKALAEESQDSKKDSENSWRGTEEDNSNVPPISADSKYCL